MKKKAAKKNCMYVCVLSYFSVQMELSFERICSVLSLFSLSYPLMSNEVDTQDDIDPLIHIAE